ncbi:MAG: ParB/RepB/Spo0J family partition protein [Clostridia bacterium]|nr:ParB/RepB/Spo0J family partition protein [Clostridia bacterium]
MALKKGLGKGLEALFNENNADENIKLNSDSLALSKIDINPEQPRKTFDEIALAELAESIKEKGVLQPLLVRPMGNRYQLIAGERRFRAAHLSKLTEVPVIIKEMSDRDAMEIALIENLQREDLNAVEEAQGIKLLMDRYDLTQEEVAGKISKSRPAVANSLRLLNLSEKILNYLKSGKLSAGHARALLSINDTNYRDELADLIVKNKLSVREVEKKAKQKSHRKRKMQSRPVYYDEVAFSLRELFGREINIKKKKKGGVMEIEFYDKDDLEKIIKIINRGN